MEQTLRFWVLLVIFIHHCITWYATLTAAPDNEEDAKKLKRFLEIGWRFLTVQNLFNQTIYVIVQLLILLFPKFLSEKSLSTVKSISWYHYWCVVYPWSIYIPPLFWTLYNYDRQLIVPSYVVSLFPLWLHHCKHTNILILLIAEFLLNERIPPKYRVAAPLYTLHGIYYVSLLNYTYAHDGLWLYDYLIHMDWPTRIVYYLATFGYSLCCLWYGLKIQNRFYERRIKAKQA